MKKIRIIQIIELIILIIIAVGLISFLSSISKKGVEEKQSKSFKYSFNFGSIGTGNFVVLKEEEVSSSTIERIKIDAGSADINVFVTNSTTIRVIESGNKGLTKEELFTLSNQNGVLTITRSKNIPKVISLGSQKHKIELFIPETYSGDLDLNTSSGDTNFLSDLKVKHLATGQASGGIFSDYSLEVESFSSHLASGDVRLEYLVCNEYKLSTASGDISINSLNGSGSIETSSGDIIIRELKGEKYRINTASGDVSLRNVESSGEISTASGDIQANYIGIGEYANLSTASGDIHIRLAEPISFEMEAKCVSGDISGTLDMNYTNKKGDAAVATAGHAPYASLRLNTISGNIIVNRK